MAENTPDATAASAQTQEVSAGAAPPAPSGASETEFDVAPSLAGIAETRPYKRLTGDPVYRPLKIYTLDPSTPRREGAIATLKVPYEKLEPGPKGSIFEVDNDDGFQRNQRVDLNDPHILMNSGLDPNPSDPRFHQQMVYAVSSSVYHAFRTALGRHVTWSFQRGAKGDNNRLLLRPHALAGERNAFYDSSTGSVEFGYFRADKKVAGRNLPGSWVFTCLSHDIIAHEVTHALLDGMRANFTIPTNPDVPGFHEAFADLVAVFQHFSYKEVVEQSIAKHRGSLQVESMLTELALQFSQTQSDQYGKALRSAVQSRKEHERRMYGEDTEPHELGSVLVKAVFQAFTAVYERKVKRFIRLATNGSGILPEGDLSPYLIAVLAAQASKLASQFLSICIRAIDYCPPVDLLFGEYLRALITADFALVPDDPWMYREALVDAFREHGINPVDVPNLSEEALLWRAPEETLPPCPQLSFEVLKFQGDPSMPAGPSELHRQARDLGAFILAPGRAKLFGLVTRAEAERDGLDVARPCIHSIRSTRRVGPQGQIVFDLVAEVTQSRLITTLDGRRLRFYGGSTIILDPEGEIRYVIAKGVRSATREQRQREYMSSADGGKAWLATQSEFVPQPQLFRFLHTPEAK